MMTLDLAIIGAGISGLAAARSVLAEHPSTKLALFDREGRVGGRLMSRNLGPQTGIVELGAGRFNAGSHRRVRELVEEYGLSTKPFDYRLAPLQTSLHEQARQMLSEMCAQLARLYTATSCLERHAISLRAAAERTIGGQRFDLLVDLCGFDTLNHDQLTFEEGFGILRHHPETHDLFESFDTNWSALRGGLSNLTNALANDISDQAAIHLGHDLIEICPATSGHGHVLTFQTEAGRQRVTARAMIFAMPIWNVGRIRGLNLSHAVRERIQSVPLIKAYFSYSEAWWEPLQMSGLCLSTPTTFRKIYFPKDANHLMIYCDGGSAVDLHKQFQNDPDIGSALSRVILDTLPFGTQPGAIPAPVDQGCQFWPDGISFWRCGWNLVPAGHWQIGPDASVCSDIFTPNLGWMEGALESADHAVQAYLERRSCPLMLDGTANTPHIHIGR